MDGCTAIDFVKHVKIVFFFQVGVVCAAWWHLRKLSQQSNNFHGPAQTNKTAETQNLDGDSFDSFTIIIAEQPSLTQYKRPMFYMKEK